MVDLEFIIRICIIPSNSVCSFPADLSNKLTYIMYYMSIICISKNLVSNTLRLCLVATIWTLLFYAFWCVGSNADIINSGTVPNLVEKLLGRASILGVGLIALVSGFGSANAPYHYFIATFQYEPLGYVL